MSKHDAKIYLNKGAKIAKDGQVTGILGKVIKGYPMRSGHLAVTFGSAGDKKLVKFHHMQAYEKFGDAIFEDGIVVRHLNGDPSDNSWDNIAIGTQSDNMMD